MSPGHPAYPWWVLGATSIGTFIAVLDGTIVNIALAKFQVSFGVSVDTVQWAITAYLLSFSILLTISGWLADRFGYKLIFLTGVSVFTASSFLCSISWSFTSLIVFRVIQGMGGGIIQPVGMAIVTREFPPERRGFALGFWGISSSASIAIGPTLGGWLIDSFSWHAIFDINVPFGLLGVLAGLVIFREYRSERSPSIDSGGLAALSIFLTSLLLALSAGNANWNTDGWSSSFVLGCFGVAGVSVAVFLIIELTAEHPMIDLSLFKAGNFGLANLIMFIFGLGMFGSIFLQPLYLQRSLGYTALQAGRVMLPMGICVAISAPIAGRLADRIGGKIPLTIGLVLMALSLYQYSFLSLSSESTQILVPMLFRGFGMGFIFSPLMAVSISGIPARRIGQASGLINVVRQLGGTFGVAVLSSTLAQRIRFHMNIYGQAANPQSPAFRQIFSRVSDFVVGASGGTIAAASTKSQSLISSHIQKSAYVAGIDDVFLIAAIIIVVSIVPVLFLKTRPQHASTGAENTHMG